MPAYECIDALNSAFNGDGPGYVCNLEGFCISTVDAPIKNPPPVFCQAGACVLNNPIWFSFVATSTFLDIDVCPNKCEGDGLQWALYDQCSNLLNTVACYCTPSLPGDVIFNISAPTTIGTTYYLVIDGSNGSTCAIKFRVNNGIDGVPVGDLISDVLTGPKSACQGTTANYSSLGFSRATDYSWILDGVEIATDVLSVNVNTSDLAKGDHTLCLKGSNSCSQGIWKEKCWTIEIGSILEAEAMGRVCEGSPTGYLFKGSFYQPGSYDVEVLATDGSSCDTTYHLVVEKLLKTDGPEVKLGKCEDHSMIMYQGVSYATSSPFHEIHYTNYQGCDSLVMLYVYDLSIVGSVTAEPEKIPSDGGSVVLTAHYDISLVVPPYTTLLVWRDKDLNQIAVNTDQITVSKAGTYYAEITVTIDNPVGVADEICSTSYPVVITVDNPTSVSVNENRPTFSNKIVQDYLILEKTESSNIYQVNIIDLTGKVLINSFDFTNSVIRIPIRVLPDAMYICQIMDGSKLVAVIKFVKQ